MEEKKLELLTKDLVDIYIKAEMVDMMIMDRNERVERIRYQSENNIDELSDEVQSYRAAERIIALVIERLKIGLNGYKLKKGQGKNE